MAGGSRAAQRREKKKLKGSGEAPLALAAEERALLEPSRDDTSAVAAPLIPSEGAGLVLPKPMAGGSKAAKRREKKRLKAEKDAKKKEQEEKNAEIERAKQKREEDRLRKKKEQEAKEEQEKMEKAKEMHLSAKKQKATDANVGQWEESWQRVWNGADSDSMSEDEVSSQKTGTVSVDDA